MVCYFEDFYFCLFLQIIDFVFVFVVVCIIGYEIVKGFYVVFFVIVEYLMVDIEKGYKCLYEVIGLVY